MKILKSTPCFILLYFISLHISEAQVTAGLYTNGVLSQVGIGIDPEKSFFGEGRIFAGDILNNFYGLEAIGQYNFIQSDWYNLSGGLMAGYYEIRGGRVGLPCLLAIKPIQQNSNLAIILEATPFYTNESIFFRGNFGIRYLLGKG